MKSRNGIVKKSDSGNTWRGEIEDEERTTRKYRTRGKYVATMTLSQHSEVGEKELCRTTRIEELEGNIDNFRTRGKNVEGVSTHLRDDKELWGKIESFA